MSTKEAPARSLSAFRTILETVKKFQPPPGMGEVKLRFDVAMHLDVPILPDPPPLSGSVLIIFRVGAEPEVRFSSQFLADSLRGIAKEVLAG